MVTWASCSCPPSVALSVREGPRCRKMLTIHDYVRIPKVSVGLPTSGLTLTLWLQRSRPCTGWRVGVSLLPGALVCSPAEDSPIYAICC